MSDSDGKEGLSSSDLKISRSEGVPRNYIIAQTIQKLVLVFVFFSVRKHVRLCRASSSISSFQYHYTQVVLFLLGMECAFARHTIFRHFTSKADLFWESEWLLSSHQNSIGTVRKNTCATHSQRLGKPNLSLPTNTR